MRYQPMLCLPDSFWEQSFLSVLFHDFGKVCINFQDTIHGRTKNYDNHIRHEFLSGMVLLFINRNYYDRNTLPLYAVFSHHKPLTDLLFQNDANKTLHIKKDDFEALIHFMQNRAEEDAYSIQPPSSISLSFTNVTLQRLYVLFDSYLKATFSTLNTTDRKVYIFYKAILNISDWTASGHSTLPNGLIYGADYLREKVIQKLRGDGKTEIANTFSFRDFQLDSLRPGSVLSIAPTGSGKTEAALLWASQKQPYEKIIYLLPTRVTSNAIYERLSTYFGKESCAVVHSSAFLYQKEIDDTFEKKDYLRDKSFFKNVNVCTIDQVLTQGFNLGYWELKTFHLFRASVIIDEIHLYEPYTLGLIIASITYLKQQFQTQFYIMTATMPLKLKVLLQKTLDIENEEPVQDTELLNAARNQFEVRNGLVDSLDKEIRVSIKAKKKILIVVNTVDEAIRLYKKYKSSSKNVICFHSRFIQNDRIEKEKQILALEKRDVPMLLIATQVVEVSLDIDFDILYTENAPMDAIIQRAGRVNRKRIKEATKVIVFHHQEITQKRIYPADILERTFALLTENQEQRLTEQQLIDFVDKVYEGIDVEKSESYQTGIKVYADIQRGLHQIKDNTGLQETYTREGLDSVNVIPEKFRNMLATKDVIEKSKHEVSIRNWRWQEAKKYGLASIDANPKHSWFKYLDCDYDFDKGLQFKKKADIPLTVIF